MNTSRLVDVLISTAIDQGLLFTQISSLLTFFENHGLINRRSNPVNSKSVRNIHLRYIVFRSSVDRRLHDFINEFMHSQLRLSNKNKYFAFIQAVREARVDILDLIWNFFPFDRRSAIFTYSVNQQFAFYLAAGHTDETVLNWLWNHASSDEERTEMFNRYDIISFSFAISCGNRSGLEWLLDHAPNNEIRKNIFITSMYELFGRAVTSGNVSELQWLWSNSYNNYKMQVKIFGNLVSGQLDQNVVGLDTLKWLWNHAPNDKVKRSIFVANMSKLFSRAVASGNVSELQWLWGNASNNEKRQIFIDNIFMAMNSRNVEVLEWFWNEVFDDEMLNAFRTAASKIFTTNVSYEDIDGLQ